MDDAFSPASTASNPHRKLKTSKAHQFSPSFGVHKGFIRDPSWPPAEFPAQGNAAQRQTRRIVCDLKVTADGATHAVKGDLSAGGAMFLMPAACGAKQVTIAYRDCSAQAEVLSTTTRGGLVAHHARFTDLNAAWGVWQALVSA